MKERSLKMIKIEHLTKNYGSNCAVDDISFEVQKGETVGFLGPNGAGKSTTMNILTGYLSASVGSVSIAGIDILSDPIAAKKMIGYLPEQPPVYLDMTVNEYLNFVYQLKGSTLPREEHITEILKSIKLLDVKDRLIRNLSKGYKQRVGIAEALIGDPKVIIFDEPTVDDRYPVKIFIVVLFPAPLGPRKPTVSPLATSKLMSSTAQFDP